MVKESSGLKSDGEDISVGMSRKGKVRISFDYINESGGYSMRMNQAFDIDREDAEFLMNSLKEILK